MPRPVGRPPDSFPAQVYRFVANATEAEMGALELAVELGKQQRNGDCTPRKRKVSEAVCECGHAHPAHSELRKQDCLVNGCGCQQFRAAAQEMLKEPGE